VAISTGLAFARFARSNARICDSRLKAFLAVDEISLHRRANPQTF